MELSLFFFLLGACSLLIMGAVHTLLSLRHASPTDAFAPADQKLRDKMAATPVRLTPKMSIWGAYVGFNLSHGLGILFVGSLSLLAVSQDPDAVADVAALLPLALGYCLLEVLVALRFWFLLPVVGFGFSAFCFLLAWVSRFA